MTSLDPSTNGVEMSDEEFEQLAIELLTVIEQHEKEEELEATADDYFDPSVWEQK